MKYAKLINQYPSYAPNPIHIGNRWWCNPPGSVYVAEDYKPVRFTDQPTEPGEGYQWVETWSETDTEIVQGWGLEEIPITEDEALTRYTNEITGASDSTLQEATETLIKNIKEDD